MNSIQETSSPTTLNIDGGNDDGCLAPSSRVTRLLLGLCLMFVTAIVLVTGSQLTRATYVTNTFEAPFLFVCFWSAWMILVYPIYVVQRRIRKQRDFSHLLELRSHLRLYHTGQDRQILRFLGLTLLFCVLWCVTNYTYIRALDPVFLDTSDVIALYATHFSFVYMLSWIVLFDKFVALRILAMIFSITGVVLFAYADGFGSPSMWGVILAVSSSSTVSVFKVLVKKFLDSPDTGRISFFFSLVGLFSVIIMWPIALTLCLTKVEIAVFKDIPWHFVCSSASLMTVLQVTSYYAQSVTIYAIFSGLGFAIGLPLCTVTDFLWQQKTLNGMKIAAIVMITVGLLLVLLPDQCPVGLFDTNHFSACWLWKRTDIVHSQSEVPPRGRLRRNNSRRI